MIQLNPDCLVFETGEGKSIPCSAELMTVELIGESAEFLDRELIRDIASAVLHYFKHELGREHVSMAEFSQALDRVLQTFGISLASVPPPESCKVAESDLRKLACASGKGFELIFFTSLRNEMRGKLKQSPRVLRFNGLRGCVKQLMGARRWSGRCQGLNDQIVEYLRTCLSAEVQPEPCALVIR